MKTNLKRIHKIKIGSSVAKLYEIECMYIAV